MQQQVDQLTSDLSQLKAHFDNGTAATAEAIAQLGTKLTGSIAATAVTESDLKQLYNVADDAIRSANIKIGELSVGRSERSEQKWHLTRPKDLTPGTLTKEEEWKRWKEDIEDYVDAVTPGMKEILKLVGKAKDTVEKEFFCKNGMVESWDKFK